MVSCHSEAAQQALRGALRLKVRGGAGRCGEVRGGAGGGEGGGGRHLERVSAEESLPRRGGWLIGGLEEVDHGAARRIVQPEGLRREREGGVGGVRRSVSKVRGGKVVRW